MTEIEQLRKEVNELRERIARLEASNKEQAGPMWSIPHVFMQPAKQTTVPCTGDAFPPETIIGYWPCGI